MNVPTVKYMMERLKAFPDKELTKEQAKAIRKLMEDYEAKHTLRRPTPTQTLGKINEILDYHGVESIKKGRGKKSPAIVYVNTGDTYDTTVMWVNSRFEIGCWGNYVEAGNYA